MAREAMLGRRQFVQTAPERMRPQPSTSRSARWRLPRLAGRPGVCASSRPSRRRDVPLDQRRLSPDRPGARHSSMRSGPGQARRRRGVPGIPVRVARAHLHGRGARRGAARRDRAELHRGDAPRARGRRMAHRPGGRDRAAPRPRRSPPSVVLNMAGIWIDRVNRSAASEQAVR